MPYSHVMDSADVFIGDKVYDASEGWGTVEELLLDNRMVVCFSGDRRYPYTTSGVRVGARRFRTLYWHDPVMAIPAKDETMWTLTKKLCAAISDGLREAGYK